jgi:hypothetical protein
MYSGSMKKQPRVARSNDRGWKLQTIVYNEREGAKKEKYRELPICTCEARDRFQELAPI